VGARSSGAGEIPLLSSPLYLFGEAGRGEGRFASASFDSGIATGETLVVSVPDPLRKQCQAGSLTGAVHLSNDNAGVLRPAQRRQKRRVEQKGKCRLDFDSQYEYEPRKRGLSILSSLEGALFQREVSEKLPQG
jgi:hypothetical protein